jgi:hypothetical protein
MTFPFVPEPADVAAHFCKAMQKAERLDKPYTRWLTTDSLPESMGAAILILPIKPPLIDECGGVRDLDNNNSKRYFFTPQAQKDFPTVKNFCEAFQRPDVARQFSQTCNIPASELEGSYLRIEYIQDTDGAWLEPHPDITAKLFSMVIYLCTGPEAKDWGTDIYDANKKWVERGCADFNRGVIFVRSDVTFHGYEKRPIIGVRRLMEINYVRSLWRDRDQLCYPDKPITLKG